MKNDLKVSHIYGLHALEPGSHMSERDNLKIKQVEKQMKDLGLRDSIDVIFHKE